MSELTYTDAIEQLVNTASPYTRDAFNDALFDQAMEQADQWHLANNPNYAKLWQTRAQPVLPVGLFKTLELATETHSEGIWLNSSGTGQQGKTQVFFDFLSLKRIEQAMVQVFLNQDLISQSPARFLMLSPDPKSGDHAGFATAFMKFTQCAPIDEIVFTVSADLQFDANLAWTTLARWAKDPIPIYILGLTLYFEHFCLSRPAPFSFQSSVKGITGGGWKGMTKRLERPEIILGLQETLQAPIVDIRDIYGMTEHPVQYISCPLGHFHIPAYSRFSIIDSHGELAKKEETGLIRLDNPFFASLPSHRLLTQDLGAWSDNCACGCSLPFLRYLGRATSPEGTCAAEVK